jgi:DNA-binding transcriptional ArsR family regulator
VSIKMLNTAWSAKCKTNSAKLLLLALADSANDQGDGVEECFLRLDTLSEKTGMSKRSIQYAMKELEELGFLLVQKRYGRSNIFKLFEPSNEPKEEANVQDLHDADFAQCANFASKSANFAPKSARVAPISLTYPLPNQKESEQAEPVTTPESKKTAPHTFSTFLKNCAAKNELPIPESDTVFDYTAKAGIPGDVLEAHWLRFREKYEGEYKSKKYSDWRQTFRNSVKDNWYKFWYFAADGAVLETSQLRQFIAASGVTA